MSLSKKAADGSGAYRVRLDTTGRSRPGSPASQLRVPSATTNLAALRKCRRGAAAAEFALVAPVMMGLLFGTFEYGIAFFTYNTMQNAVRDVGRQVAVNTLLVGSAEAAIRARLPAWARDDATLTIEESSPANPNTNVYTFAVSMPMSAATPVQFFSRAANPTLRTEMRMKQELPYVANP